MFYCNNIDPYAVISLKYRCVMCFIFVFACIHDRALASTVILYIYGFNRVKYGIIRSTKLFLLE